MSATDFERGREACRRGKKHTAYPQGCNVSEWQRGWRAQDADESAALGFKKGDRVVLTPYGRQRLKGFKTVVAIRRGIVAATQRGKSIERGFVIVRLDGKKSANTYSVDFWKREKPATPKERP